MKGDDYLILWLEVLKVGNIYEKTRGQLDAKEKRQRRAMLLATKSNVAAGGCQN
jgi:hypothetical protein